MVVAKPASADYNTVTSSSQQLTIVANAGYVLVTSVAAWVAQGTNPTASAADGSMYVPADTPTLINGDYGVKVAVLRVGSSDGVCTLTRVVDADV